MASAIIIKALSTRFGFTTNFILFRLSYLTCLRDGHDRILGLISGIANQDSTAIRI